MGDRIKERVEDAMETPTLTTNVPVNQSVTNKRKKIRYKRRIGEN